MAKDNIKRKAKSKNKHKAQEAGEGILDDVAVGRERQQERRLPIISSNCVEIEQRRGAHEQSRNANSRIDNLALDTGKSPLDTTSVKRNVAIFSNIWIVLSCFFCFTSSYYMPEDDYILYTGSDDETDIPVISSRKKKQKIPEAVIADSMRVLDWNSDLPAPNLQAIGTLTFCKEGDYFNDKELLGSHLLEEGQRIIKIFAGIKRISGLTFNWTLRASKKGIDVHTCDVPNSPWLAVKSDSIIKRDKFEILKLFLDDSRSHEYDETMEGYQVI